MSTPVSDGDEILKRHVPVESWLRPDGTPKSVNYHPTPKDNRRLSTDRQRIPLQTSIEVYRSEVGRAPWQTWPYPVGIALSAHECLVEVTADPQVFALSIEDDGGEGGLHDGHASVIFAPEACAASKSQSRRFDERLALEIREASVGIGQLSVELTINPIMGSGGPATVEWN